MTLLEVYSLLFIILDCDSLLYGEPSAVAIFAKDLV